MLKFMHDLTMLSFEAQTVIGLRVLKFADGGPAAHAEARRMVTEKIGAAWTATQAISSGGSASAVFEIYRKAVKNNARRLASRRPRA
jgi:hypothetical protein